MDHEHTVLLHDLLILEEMAANMAAYLDSDAKEWTIPRSNMPNLTIGGYLMREHRLRKLEDALADEDSERLRRAISGFEDALVERVVRFETRAHQELHGLIGEWVIHLRDLGTGSITDVNYYAGIVDTRVVITSLMDRLQTRPYQLQKGVQEEVQKLDANLQRRLEDHAFIWESFWQPAYPREKYWYLYVCPKGGAVG